MAEEIRLEVSEHGQRCQTSVVVQWPIILKVCARVCVCVCEDVFVWKLFGELIFLAPIGTWLTWLTTNASTSLYGFVESGLQRVWFLQGHSAWPSERLKTTDSSNSSNRLNILTQRWKYSSDRLLYMYYVPRNASSNSLRERELLIFHDQFPGMRARCGNVHVRTALH